MIASRFNISVPDFPEKGRHLLFNTRSQAQVVIDDRLMTALAALPSVADAPDATHAFAQLASMGFVVGSCEEDTEALERYFARVREDDAVLRPTVLTTYACNFACSYCVEEGVRGPVFMDEPMAEEAVRYICSKFEEYGSRQISLTFYGGEPLLNMPVILQVARALGSYASARSAPFGFGLSTNGALLTEATVQELKPLGLTGAKITLDGPQETHDRTRPFKNGVGSFETLMRNICAIASLTAITLEINFDETNAARVPELLDELAGRGLAGAFREVILCPISATPHDREGIRAESEIDCALLSLDAARRLMELRATALERGFVVRAEVMGHMCEMIMRRTSFIIDPRGNLCRCGGLAGRREFGFGNILGAENDTYLGRELWRRCVACAYVPLCGDGCPFGSYVRFGDPLKLSCGKESLEYLVRESLALAYRRKSRTSAR